AGCSEKPSHSQVEKLLVQHIENHMMDDPLARTSLFDVKNITVTDGFQKDITTYIADIKYDVTCKVDFIIALRLISNKVLFKDLPNNYQATWSDAEALNKLSLIVEKDYGKFRAGDVLHRTNKVKLIRKDSGWSI